MTLGDHSPSFTGTEWGSIKAFTQKHSYMLSCNLHLCYWGWFGGGGGGREYALARAYWAELQSYHKHIVAKYLVLPMFHFNKEQHQLCSFALASIKWPFWNNHSKRSIQMHFQFWHWPSNSKLDIIRRKKNQQIEISKDIISHYWCKVDKLLILPKV